MNEISEIKKAVEGKSPGEVIKYALNRFGRNIALASSFGAEDQAVTHMMWSHDPKCRVFTLDTGRLPQETYDTIEKTREAYGLDIEIVFPDYNAVEKMVNERGINLFYKSVENRKLCCYTRKVEPLKRKLSTLKAWMTGQRKSQSVTRQELDIVEADKTYGLIKFNPLADWSDQDVWDYVHKNKIPYNPLHDQGYPSIGCAPCTRAVKPGEDIRSGRWWWENPEQKECGLHVVDGKLIRRTNDK